MSGSQKITAGSERKPKAIYKHVVAGDAERWVFRRSAAFDALVVGMFMVAGIFFFLIPLTFLKPGLAEIWLVIVSVIPFGLSSWPFPWPSDFIVLKVYPDGRVGFNRRQLCAAGSVRAVFIATVRPLADWEVYLHLDDGTFVRVPPPYLGDFELREQACPLGEELAKALKVELKESL
jgi:hypothetical protein